MEMTEYIKHEKKHLARLKQMRADIYPILAKLNVEISKSKEPVKAENRSQCQFKKLGAKVWAGVYDCAWFRISGQVPKEAIGKCIVAKIDIGGEGAFFDADNNPYAAITNDHTYLDKVASCVAKSLVEITPCSKGGEVVELYLDGGFNGNYLQPYGFGKFKYAYLCSVNSQLKDFYYDYLTLLYAKQAHDSDVKKKHIEALLDSAYNQLGQCSSEEVSKAREVLMSELNGTPSNLEFTAIGHSHLDLAWLWPIRETKRKATRTFANQLTNIKNYDEYIYGASQPQQFEYIKNRYPKQYQQLKENVLNGRIEPQGGMWVEADTNISSGESLIRQIYYGKKFFFDEFNQKMKMCWLPDVFGYNANLPQILQKSGLPYFMTIKLSWNEHNKFPHRTFNWTGIDGSKVLVHMAPDNNYNSGCTPMCVKNAEDNFVEKDRISQALMIYGIGDGGGGPGEAHIEIGKRQSKLDGRPVVKFSKAVDFFDRLNAERDKLINYVGELYLEKHQGTYTSQARNKRYNRQIEYKMQDLEHLSTMAYLKGYEYNQELIDRLWKEILLYQFHDIIPGSSVTRVYEESRERYRHMLSEIEVEKQKIFAYLGQDELSAYNPTDFSTNKLMKVGNEVFKVSANAHEIVKPIKIDIKNEFIVTKSSIENSNLRVSFNKYGEINSLVDLHSGIEYCKEYLNRLNLYSDKFLHYNAWDIDWKYYEKAKTRLKAYKHEYIVECDRVVRRNYYRHFFTTIIQDVSLFIGGDTVEFATNVNYKEVLRMLRADFSPAIETDKVSCDIQLGTFTRTTKDESPIEKAQFEVCAHKYIDLSQEEKGIALMNDCKYGHRVKDGLISLNLIRSPIYPDIKADKCTHTFKYALYPHDGVCDERVLSRAYQLNKPLEVVGTAPQKPLFEKDNVTTVIDTIKKAYDKNAVVVRIYESQGKSTVCNLQTNFAYRKAYITNLVEEDAKVITDTTNLSFTPYEIKTILFEV